MTFNFTSFSDYLNQRSEAVQAIRDRYSKHPLHQQLEALKETHYWDLSEKVKAKYETELKELEAAQWNFQMPKLERLTLKRDLAALRFVIDDEIARAKLDHEIAQIEAEEKLVQLDQQMEAEIAEVGKAYEEAWKAHQKNSRDKRQQEWEAGRERRQREWEEECRQRQREYDASHNQGAVDAKAVYREMIKAFHPDKHRGSANYDKIVDLIKQVNNNANNAYTLTRLKAQLEQLV